MKTPVITAGVLFFYGSFRRIVIILSFSGYKKIAKTSYVFTIYYTDRLN